MKKTAFIVTIALAGSLASCNKNRTCTCTHSKSWSSGSEIHITTYNDISKKSALANCTSGTSYDPSDPSKVEMRDCSLD